MLGYLYRRKDVSMSRQLYRSYVKSMFDNILAVVVYRNSVVVVCEDRVVYLYRSYNGGWSGLYRSSIRFVRDLRVTYFAADHLTPHPHFPNIPGPNMRVHTRNSLYRGKPKGFFNGVRSLTVSYER
jgi:hypothetical protein